MQVTAMDVWYAFYFRYRSSERRCLYVTLREVVIQRGLFITKPKKCQMLSPRRATHVFKGPVNTFANRSSCEGRIATDLWYTNERFVGSFTAYVWGASFWLPGPQFKDFPQITNPVARNCGSGSVVVEALYYKPEGHGFETRWGKFQFT
jgi:hypothetical protein